MIERNVLLIGTDGEAVGQVNGLSVMSLGDFAFGAPSRVTASVGLGKEGIIDIQREARLAGPIHTKGVLILSGYLAGKYAHDKPLSLSARLVFEQNYGMIEGDSASSTELYALLSALSEVPVKQGLAVTGSVNQKGEVQAIGGVNEKIEGFFEICNARSARANSVCCSLLISSEFLLRNSLFLTSSGVQMHRSKCPLFPFRSSFRDFLLYRFFVGYSLCNKLLSFLSRVSYNPYLASANRSDSSL